ncbi:MAG: PAS domain-containing protein [Chitinivibrionales bacterium]|nr:PAS domain-containing protein [Chitinivibrionales bacterium]
MNWSSKRLGALLDAIPEGIMAVDKDKHIVFFNRSAEQIIEVDRKSALHKPCSEILRSECCAGDCPLEKMIVSGEKSFERVVRIVSASGQQKTISIATSLLTSEDGSVGGAIETFRDLSHDTSYEPSQSGAASYYNIVSINRSMQQLFAKLPTIAVSNSTVLLGGETGTGKELFARALHSLSMRSGKPFVAVNCGALPDNLLEAELFGHKAGAFTDAKFDRRGRFAKAEGGTIFLDEIGETSTAMQIKLLRVLQDKTYEPVGSDATRHADVRIIAATNKDLLKETEQGAFRKDLYYRLNVINLTIPQLKDRRDDIPVLADYFIRRLNVKQKKRIRGLHDEALAALMAYDYPGNVRELENAVEYAFVICPKGYIELQHLPDTIRHVQRTPDQHENTVDFKSVESSFILNALERNGWNYQETARELRIHRTSLYRKMKKYAISRQMRREDAQR